MKDKLIFQSMIEKELFEFLKSNKQRKILNFLNQHDLYQFRNEKQFKKALQKKENLNFIDGFTISAYLSLKSFKRIPRIRGPTFTRDFLTKEEFSKSKKHFFIVPDSNYIEKLKNRLPEIKKIEGYNPPYIKGIKFSKKETQGIIKLINKKNPDIVWIGIASPKQNILASELLNKTNAQYFVNIGAALDFLLGKKEEAPLMIRELGIEWLYRLITDFKYTKKKVWKSFIGLKYLKDARLDKR